MTASDGGSEAFQVERGRLFGIAYRMLGSATDAEDVVQDAWLRWSEAARDDVDSPRAFLARIVTRLCLDRLKSARARRESYVGEWLPEPLRTPIVDGAGDRESISIAFLLLLERLTPAERAAYVLHEVFDYGHAEIAAILGTNEAACRQLLHRARERLTGARRFTPSREAHERLLMGFLQACATGDLAGLERLLAHDVTAISDGGGKAKAALKPVFGAHRVARFFLGQLARRPRDMSTQIVEVNGAAALVVRLGERISDLVILAVDAGTDRDLDRDRDRARIREIYIVRNPDKLARLAAR